MDLPASYDTWRLDNGERSIICSRCGRSCSDFEEIDDEVICERCYHTLEDDEDIGDDDE